MIGFFRRVACAGAAVVVGAVSAYGGECQPEWSALLAPNGEGTSGSVSAFAVFDDGTGPSLYAGGSFANAGGVTVNGIARWDGTAWSALEGPGGIGVSGSFPAVFALAAFDDGTGPALYVGGAFASAGGVTVNGIARWDGSAWSGLDGPGGVGVGGGAFTQVVSLAVFDDGNGPALYAGGLFANAGGVLVNGIARWDGSAWSELAGPSGVGIAGGSFSQVLDLAVYDDGSGPALYAAGTFLSAGGVLVNGIARWDGSVWSALSGPNGVGVTGGGDFGEGAFALEVFDDGTGPGLYVGGLFVNAGGLTANRIARWDASGWSVLTGAAGPGVAGNVFALSVFDYGTGPALYVGGDFLTIGTLTVNRIARWDGSEWSGLETSGAVGVNGFVESLVVYDDGARPALYLGGSFLAAGGVEANGVARWTCRPPCPVDVSDDGFVNLADLNAVLGNFGVSLPVYSVDDFEMPVHASEDPADDPLISTVVAIDPGSYEAIEIVFDFVDPQQETTWASDMQMAVVFGNGLGRSVLFRGSFSGTSGAVFDPALFDEVSIWDFDGNQSAPAGTYSHAYRFEIDAMQPEPEPGSPTTVLVEFTDIFEGGYSIQGMRIRLIPSGGIDGDTNGDGAVNLADLNAVLAAFGTACP